MTTTATIARALTRADVPCWDETHWVQVGYLIAGRTVIVTWDGPREYTIGSYAPGAFEEGRQAEEYVSVESLAEVVDHILHAQA